MPIKLTWKSIAGVLSILAGAITQAVGTHTLPASVSNTLIVIGGFIVGAERIADALDYSTNTNVTYYPTSKAAAFGPITTAVSTLPANSSGTSTPGAALAGQQPAPPPGATGP